MPGMARPLNQACKVAFDVLGVPVTLQDDKGIKKYIKSTKNIQKTNYPKVDYNP